MKKTWNAHMFIEYYIHYLLLNLREAMTGVTHNATRDYNINRGYIFGNVAGG